MRGLNADRRTISAADTGRNIRRNHCPHVTGKFTVTLAKPQIQVPLRPVRRLPADHIALGGERFKSLQLGFKFGHDALP